jgi:hypothetical protein
MISFAKLGLAEDFYIVHKEEYLILIRTLDKGEAYS